MRTRIKFCGVTRPDDAVKAAELGVDAIGLVFYPGSPRFVTITQAVAICNNLPAFVTVVGLFVNAEADDISETLANVPLDLLQFHGDETSAECEQYNMPYVKAIRLRQEITAETLLEAYPSARALVLDTFIHDQPGGTGESFDWNMIPANLDRPLILAGGLTAENIFDAITKVRPFGVDVSSGIESDKGLKDYGKMKAFIRGVMRADESQFHEGR